jgi:hypothetical protein
LKSPSKNCSISAIFSKKNRHVEKNDPHIRIPAAFLGLGWDKLGGKIHLDLMAFSGLWARCKSGVFWQTERYLGVFSTRTEKGGFLGFSGINYDIRREIGARMGRILARLRKDLKLGLLSKIPL